MVNRLALVIALTLLLLEGCKELSPACDSFDFSDAGATDAGDGGSVLQPEIYFCG